MTTFRRRPLRAPAHPRRAMISLTRLTRRTAEAGDLLSGQETGRTGKILNLISCLLFLTGLYFVFF